MLSATNSWITCCSQAEVPDPVVLKVTGQLPAWLSGSLIRNGPGTFDVPINDGKFKGTTFTFKHMCATALLAPFCCSTVASAAPFIMCRLPSRFDALGLVHKVDIDGAAGKVTYMSRKLNRGTEAYISAEGVLPPNGGTFAQPPATGLVGRALAGVAGAVWSKLMMESIWTLLDTCPKAGQWHGF